MFLSSSDKVVDKNPANTTGITPLHLAASKGHLDVCKFIINTIDDKQPRTSNGRTPLDLARRRNHVQVVAFLS